MKKLAVLSLLVSIFFTNCETEQKKIPADKAVANVEKKETPVVPDADIKVATPAEIIARKQVPILCYHRIENKNTSSDYTVSIDAFKAQMKLLADSGYHTILPDQLF